MLNISIEDYKDAINNALTERQKEILREIKSMPKSAATAEQLAERLEYKNFNAANLQVGSIGKRIAEYLDLDMPRYQYNRSTLRDKYYLVIGPYTKEGWKMHGNLKAALK